MSKSVNVDFVTRQIEVDTDGKEHFISAAMAAKDAEQSMLNAQNAATTAEKIASDLGLVDEAVQTAVSSANTASNKADIAAEQASIATNKANEANLAATTATSKADAASTSATNAAQSYANADAIATQLTEYLATKETLTAPEVDKTLLIEGAAADSKVVGELKGDLGNYEKEIVLEKNIVETIISGKYALFTGNVGSNVLVQNNDSYCYMKINVIPNKYYSLSKNFDSDSFCGIADKNDKIIGKLNLYRDTEKTGYVFLTPPNAKYMYISLTPVTNDYVVIETDSDIRDYNSTEYPFDTVKKVIINKLSNETIMNLSKDMYGIIPNHNVGFVTKDGNINQGASGNHYAIISGVSKGDIIVFSGQYSWGVLWGYYADGTPIELLGAGSYDKKRVIISDENIVKVIGWSADSRKELYIELIGLKNKCDILQTEITNKTGNEIRVGLGKEFTTIQSAIEYAKLAYDVNTIPVTILVDNGVYEVSPKSESPYYAIDKGANKISIKGESRDGTIIKCICTSELQGIVLNIGGDCTIENLTIENLADNSYTDETVLEGNHRPYCIHNDTPFATSVNYYTTVKNCKLYSQCDTPIGAGLHDKQTQRYENVECIYDSNVNKQHGSMYIHAPYDANFMPNGLEIVDCVLVSLNEMPALCLWDVFSVGTLISNTKQTFIRNITATNGNNELSISGYNKTIYSKCNSNSNLNI